MLTEADRTTQQLSITLPNEMVGVKIGEYATESEVSEVRGQSCHRACQEKMSHRQVFAPEAEA